ncbi:CAP domain-containing protein [Labilibacter marinus]|uniref:CAP domain-containing protein n=1 Tax=Labilibacter marinus TaxID=1477105 RepID=UPI000831C4F4|nr:CAP domain-containing protein [Labilibacter marinus]
MAQLSTHEQNYLSDALFNKVNELRVSKKLEVLTEDSNLIKAAQLHSSYMARVNRLSHKESSSKLRTPSLRVKKFASNFELVGENILYVQNKKKHLKDDMMDALAQEMFTGWKESPGHYANMTHPNYELGGFGFARSTRGMLYATHVMATKGIVINGQKSDNAFGVKPADNSCNKFLQSRDNFVINMGNSLQTYGNKVEMYYHSKSLIDEMIPNAKDGIAIDLVTRDQFTCKSENIIDFSPVYDGVMLKPVYRDELFKNNTAESKFRFISEVGTIPDEFHEKDYKPNLIYIINGKVCRYNQPITIPRGRYSLQEIEPRIMHSKQYPLLKWGIVNSETMYFDFDRGMTSPVRENESLALEGKLKEVEIVSYSSIEGDSVKNSILQQERASYIKNYLKDLFGSDNVPTTVKAKENWETMDFQLELMALNDMRKKSHEELRKFVSIDTLHNWDSLLYIQRRSYATIFYEGKLNPSDSLYYQQNFHSGIHKSNVGISNRALAEIYKNNSLHFYLFHPSEMEFILSKPELVQNTAAILSKIYDFDLEQSVLFLRHWLNHPDDLTQDAKYNLSILYCQVVSYILHDWDVSNKVFEKIVNPHKIEDIISEFQGIQAFNQLILNYHLTAIKYFGQNNDAKGLNYSFGFIEKYFKQMALDIQDEIDLCLFYNSWSRYDLTIEMLLKRSKQKGFNEEAAFILAQTSMAYPSRLKEEELNKIMSRAFRFNKKRWCTWVDLNFQNLRYPKMKEIYCKECNK